MTILFLAALVLAIPTYGLSVLAWLVLFFFNAKSKGKEHLIRVENMQSTRSVLDTLVGGEPSDLYQALDVPTINGMTTTVAQDEQCGRHILNFIAHNPAVLQNFMTALKLHQLKGSNQLPSAIDALRYEKEWGTFSLMHQVCYEAVITLKMQNNLPCFGNVDVMTMLNEEAGQKFKSSRSQYEDDEVPF